MKKLARGRTLWEVGGLIAGLVLVAFGAASLYLGATGVGTIRDSLKQEYIVGTPDMTPSAIAASAEESGLSEDIALPTCTVAEQAIDTGAKAKCFAEYMRIHALESTGGLTYAQMGRFVAAADPADPAGTSDEAAALVGDDGKPVPNAARNTWIDETALTTALNTSFFAERVALFSIIVGIALVLAGAGFVVLAEVTLRRRTAAAAAPGTGLAGAAPAK